MLITQMHNITVSRKSEKCMNYEGTYQKVSPITNMNTVKKENVKHYNVHTQEFHLLRHCCSLILIKTIRYSL